MARRYERVRLENARMTNGARRHRFDGDSPIPFLCECDDDGCGDFVRLTLPDYDDLRDRGLYLVSPGHAFGAGRLVTSGGAYDGYLLP